MPPPAYDAENRLISAGGQTYLYDGDGERIIQSASNNSRKFTGDERDTESSLDHTWVSGFVLANPAQKKFWQYSSSLGRWTTPDPADFIAANPTNPQSWNRYAYVINNPLALVDPSGLNECAPGEHDCNTGEGEGSPGQNIIGDPEIDFGNFWDGQSHVGIGGGSFGNYATIMVNLPGYNITYGVSAISGIDLAVNFDTTDYINQLIWVPGTGAGPSIGGGGGGNSSPSSTWAAIKTFFTPPSTGPGSCAAVFLNSVQNSGGNALRSVATNLQKYGQAVASGLAGSGVTAANAKEVVGAMVAGGQLSPGLGALVTNAISGTAEVGSAAAPYVVTVGGYFTLGAFDALLLKGVRDELRAALKGQCKP